MVSMGVKKAGAATVQPGGSPLPPPASAALVEELGRRRARPNRLLRETRDLFEACGVEVGVATSFTGNKSQRALLIKPTGTHPLNRRAAELAAMADIRLLYDPHGLAAHDHPQALLDTAERDLILPNDIALRLDEHPAFVHELGHAVVYAKRRGSAEAARPFLPFLGRLETTHGRLGEPDRHLHRCSPLPDEIARDVRTGYNKGFDLDEVRSFWLEAAATLSPALTAACAHGKAPDPAVLEGVRTDLLAALEQLSDRVVQAEYLAAQVASAIHVARRGESTWTVHFDPELEVTCATCALPALSAKPQRKGSLRLSLYLPEVSPPSAGEPVGDLLRELHNTRLPQTLQTHLTLARRARALHRAVSALARALFSAGEAISRSEWTRIRQKADAVRSALYWHAHLREPRPRDARAARAGRSAT